MGFAPSDAVMTMAAARARCASGIVTSTGDAERRATWATAAKASGSPPRAK